MNTDDNNSKNYYIESVKKAEVEQKCFDKTYKNENNFSLQKNKGKNTSIYLNIKRYYIRVSQSRQLLKFRGQ